MPAKRPQRLVGLIDLLKAGHPAIDDPEAAIKDGSIQVDGTVVVNPRSRVRREAVIKVSQPAELRGATKLAAALNHFNVAVDGRTALDLGASSGGFTSVLVDRGARLVYAVDVGYGLLLGSLRQNPRVRNLERTNLAILTVDLIPDCIDVITVDLSYLSLTDAIGQIEGIQIADDADLIALVKPMFELGLGELPTTDEQLEAAVERARTGVERSAWSVHGVITSPISGSHGAREFLLYARRSTEGHSKGLPPDEAAGQ
jgi:23S rRNA (cytidine1920-2'-O)/16S rRNA (cytidine1409-2'-O)-methyltransferase